MFQARKIAVLRVVILINGGTGRPHFNLPRVLMPQRNDPVKRDVEHKT